MVGGVSSKMCQCTRSSVERAQRYGRWGRGFESLRVRVSKNPEWDKGDYSIRRAKALAYLGGICVDCGTGNDLTFDHRDSSQKSFAIGKNLNRRWDVLVVELDKCDLRCRPCHRMKTTVKHDIGMGRVRETGRTTWNKGLKTGPRKSP